MRWRAFIWNSHRIAALYRMLDEGYRPQAIADELGMNVQQVRNKIYNDKSGGKRGGGHGHHTTIPDEVLADRERRILARRSITNLFMGDPPPGWSALDRKNGAST